MTAPPRKPPSHLSHSSRETLLRCARAYFLKKIAGAPERPALWSAGGSAVHEATEKWDRMRIHDADPPYHVGGVWDACFHKQLEEARSKEPNENAWRWSKTEPVEVWNTLGPQFIRSYIDWRKRSPWEIWTTPDGEPAIELDVSGYLPDCPVEIKGYVDRVFVDPLFNRLWIVDLKTGKRPPKNADQFATYKALITEKYDIAVEVGGVPFMNRTATLGKPFDLSDVDSDQVGWVYAEAWEQIQAGDFPANGYPGECFICDVSAACHAQNGPLSARYDPDNPDYVPF